MEFEEIRKVLKDFCDKCEDDEFEINEEFSRIKEIFQEFVENKEFGKAEFVVVELGKARKDRNVQDCVSEFAFIISAQYRKDGLLQKAVLYGKISVKASKNFKIFSEKTAKCLMNLASVYVAMEEHRKALKKLNKSLEILRKVTELEPSEESKYMLAINLFNIAAEEENLSNFDSSQSMYLATYEYLQQNFESPNSNLVYKISVSIERVQKLKDSQVHPKTKKKMTKFGVFAYNNPYKTSTTKFTHNKSKKKIKDLETKPLAASVNIKSGLLNKNISYIDTEMDPAAESQTDKKKFSSPELSPRSSQASHGPFPTNHEFPNDKNPFLSVFSASQPKTNEKNVIEHAENEPAAGFPMILKGEAPTSNNNENLIAKPSEPETKNPFKPAQALSEYTETENEKKEKLSFFTRKKNIIAPKNSTCISISKIEFDMNEFIIEYSVKLNLSVLEILCKNSKSSYTLELPIQKNTSLLDYIKTSIEPCLYIKNEILVLEPKNQELLIQGLLLIDSFKYSIKIFRLYPRWNIQVDINEQSEVFEMINIQNSCSAIGDIRNNLTYLLTFFMYDSKGIHMNFPINLPFNKIFGGIVQSDHLDKPLKISIFKVNYLNSISYLVQSEDNCILPLIVDIKWLYKKADRIKLELEELINLFLNTIALDNTGQMILIEKSAEENAKILKIQKINARSLSNEHYSISESANKSNNIKTEFRDLDETPYFISLSKENSEVNLPNTNPMKENTEHSKTDENLSEFNEPKQDLIPEEKEKKIGNTIEEFNKIHIKGKPIEHIAYGDRIILRTCLYRNNLLYQVSMTISEEDSLNFYIRKGSGSENTNKFSIPVKILCNKTGIDRNYLIPLGSYVLRNMLTIKNSDICYFDFTRLNFSPMRAIDKISSLLKGFLIRKQINLKLKNLAYKRKIKLNTAVYTCLIYLSTQHIYLRLVKSYEVLSLDLVLNKLVKDGHFTNIEKFFTGLTSLGLKIIEKNGKKILMGLEKYRIG